MANPLPNGKNRLISQAYDAPGVPKQARQQPTSMQTPLTLAALALLVVAGTVALVVGRNLLREAPEVPRPQMETVQTTAPAPLEETPKAKAKAFAVVPIKNMVLPQVGTASKPKIPAPKEIVRTNDPPREALLECVGSLSAMHLYQSYLNLGLLADAYEHETYKQAEAEQILGTIVTLVQTLDEQMAKLEAGKLEPVEAKALKEVRQIAKKLEKQADHLREIWDADDPQASTRYQDLRKETWTDLRAVLGISEPTEPE